METKIYQVDSFTSKPFAGNPAGVCVLSEPQADSWMQSVAREMNLSETAFLHPEADGFRLRWFTPLVEVSLCGHATLASAHILWERDIVTDHKPVKFFTQSGLLSAEREDDRIVLNFPARFVEAVPPPAGLFEALNVDAKFIGREKSALLIEVENEDIVRSVKPDFGLLKKVDARGVAVTCAASMPGFDFVSRYFAPKVGVDEDPVTGSAHCYLTPYWAKKLGKTNLHAFQASQRGGELFLRWAEDRVFIAGEAVTVLTGTLFC